MAWYDDRAVPNGAQVSPTPHVGKHPAGGRGRGQREEQRMMNEAQTRAAERYIAASKAHTDALLAAQDAESTALSLDGLRQQRERELAEATDALNAASDAGLLPGPEEGTQLTARQYDAAVRLAAAYRHYSDGDESTQTELDDALCDFDGAAHDEERAVYIPPPTEGE